jgi:hypothetical protein
VTVQELFPNRPADHVFVRTKEIDIALATFERIRAAFPTLSMEVDLLPKHVDVAMRIPAQPGLLFDVDLNLQNLDELHLRASALWVEWFPCTKPQKVERFFEAVSGLLAGRLRILEHWRGRRRVKAELQRPTGEGWKTIANWTVLLSIPWPGKTYRVVQNSSVPQGDVAIGARAAPC